MILEDGDECYKFNMHTQGRRTRTVFQLQLDLSDIPWWADRYRYSKDDTNALEAGRQISRGDCDRDHLKTIHQWKTRGRRRSLLSLNTEEAVRAAFRQAAFANEERKA